MPRSVIVLSTDPDLFGAVRRALGSDPRFVDCGDELHCDGVGAPLSNLFPIETVAAEWEDWATQGSPMPDPRTMSLLIFECRSAQWVAEVGVILAGALPAPVWFVDAADRAWPAGEVDPERIALS